MSIHADHYDTVVVGAGPAGVMSAMHAAERGAVLLIDASRLPRDKSCGGMLNEFTQHFLGEFGTLPDGIRLDPKWVHFRYNDWDRKVLKPTSLRFANVDRRGFDTWLMSLLPDAVSVADGTTLSGLTLNGRVECALRSSDGEDTAVTCENLIGCDGPRSTVRQALGAPVGARYVTLQDFCILEGDIDPYFDCIYLRDIGDSFAYAYVVPKGATAIVGSVFYPRTKHPHEKQDLALSILREHLPLGESVKREAWVAMSVRRPEDVTFGAGRVLLAGEAGGFMSPTSGEGISYALNTGRMAGMSVASSTPDEALTTYQKSGAMVAGNIRRKLKWLPFMESDTGKYLAGLVPAPLVSRITQGL